MRLFLGPRPDLKKHIQPAQFLIPSRSAKILVVCYQQLTSANCQPSRVIQPFCKRSKVQGKIDANADTKRCKLLNCWPGRCAGKSISTQGCICAGNEISHHSPAGHRHRGQSRPVKSSTRASSEACLSDASLLCHSPGWPHEPEAKTTERQPRPVFLSDLPLFPFLFIFFIFSSSFSAKSVQFQFQFPLLFAKKPDVLRPSRA